MAVEVEVEADNDLLDIKLCLSFSGVWAGTVVYQGVDLVVLFIAMGGYSGRGRNQGSTGGAGALFARSERLGAGPVVMVDVEGVVLD